MRYTVGLLVVAGVGALLFGFYLSSDRSERLATSTTTSPERAEPAPQAPASLTVLSRPEDTPAPTRAEVQAPPTTEIDGPTAPPVPEEPRLAPAEWAVVLADQRVRIHVLEEQVSKLQAELDECKNGMFSALGTAKMLPEWESLDTVQRSIVTNFLTRFPVQLGPSEAKLIATYTSPDGNTMANLIAMLGRARVLQSMSPEARVKYQRDDPEEFEEYFGTP